MSCLRTLLLIVQVTGKPEILQGVHTKSSLVTTPPSTFTDAVTKAVDTKASQEGLASSKGMPFTWTCHMRHYYSPLAKDSPSAETSVERRDSVMNDYDGAGGDGGGGYRRSDADAKDVVPPPPVVTVGLGMWNVAYGFEYSGTLERLWLTPLSERCLLHAARSASVSID